MKFPKPCIVEWMLTSLPAFRCWSPKYKALRERPFCWMKSCTWNSYNAIFFLPSMERQESPLSLCLNTVEKKTPWLSGTEYTGPKDLPYRTHEKAGIDVRAGEANPLEKPICREVPYARRVLGERKAAQQAVSLVQLPEMCIESTRVKKAPKVRQWVSQQKWLNYVNLGVAMCPS